MKNKKYPEEGHLLESEICNKNGNYNQNALNFYNDIEKEINKIMLKHKGKLSINAMQNVMGNVVWQRCVICTALSSFS